MIQEPGTLTKIMAVVGFIALCCWVGNKLGWL